MATPTYVALGTITLASTDSEIVFSSIPATYRDLVLSIHVAGATTRGAMNMRMNSDTGSNYHNLTMGGTGLATFSYTESPSNRAFLSAAAEADTGAFLQINASVMDYSATDKHKTTISRASITNGGQPRVEAVASRWANTAAVTSLTITYNNVGGFATGSTFSLYGVN